MPDLALRHLLMIRLKYARYIRTLLIAFRKESVHEA